MWGYLMERNCFPSVFPTAFMRESSLTQICEIMRKVQMLQILSGPRIACMDLLVSMGQG